MFTSIKSAGKCTGNPHILLLQNVEKLSHTYDNIVGDVLLAASCVAYLGPFILDYRQVREWKNKAEICDSLDKKSCILRCTLTHQICC